MSALIFDAHAHYNDDRFGGEQAADGILDELLQSGVGFIVNAATDLDSAAASLALTERHNGVFAAVGIYPGECMKYAEHRDETVCAVRELLSHPKAVAIGEIGLDYHYDDTPRSVQREWFMQQLELSAETGYPVVIHDREAHGDVCACLASIPGAHGVFHSYSGSAEMAREVLKMGYDISFSGTVTFKNANKLLDAVRYVPPERMLIETDCPYLAPVPMRGKTNHSGYLTYTAAAIAAIKGMTTDEVIRITCDNARRLFGI